MQFLKLKFQSIINLQTVLDLETHMVSQILMSLRKSNRPVFQLLHISQNKHQVAFPARLISSSDFQSLFQNIYNKLFENASQQICVYNSLTKIHFNIAAGCSSHCTLSNYSGYTLMIKEHIPCCEKYTILYTGQ